MYSTDTKHSSDIYFCILNKKNELLNNVDRLVPLCRENRDKVMKDSKFL